MRIDSHQHFWRYHPVKDAWINDRMHVLKQDFLPTDLEPLLIQHQIDGCVAVQADQSEQETLFLLELAKQNTFIKGVVGWVDLCAEHVEERLNFFSEYPIIKGFRHILQAEPNLDFMLSPNFCKGISQLEKYGYTYDLLIYPKHLPFALQLVQQFPNQKFVIDHLAKPNIKEHLYDEWENGIKAIGKHQNVYCKVSGLVTEANWNHWTQADFSFCLDIIVDTFGMDRLMYGSDWPVCLLSGRYDQTISIMTNYFNQFSKEDCSKIEGLTAQSFYQL